MKKTIIALAVAGAVSLSNVANANSIGGGISSATQDLTVGNVSASTTGTGLYIDWRADRLFGDHVGWGVLWNSATDVGNVLEIYAQPKLTISPKAEAFARLGISKSGATSAASTAGTSLAWGVGATYRVMPQLDAEIVYDKLYSDENWDMSSISLGIQYHY